MSGTIATGQITLYDYTDATISLSTDNITVDSDLRENTVQITVQDKNGNVFRPDNLWVDGELVEFTPTQWPDGKSFEHKFTVNFKNDTLLGGTLEFKIRKGDAYDTALLHWTRPLGAGIRSQIVKYAVTDKPSSGYTKGYPEDVTWSDTQPSTNAGDYLWVQTKVSFTDPGVADKYYYSFSRITRDPSKAVVTVTLYQHALRLPAKPTGTFTYSWKKGGKEYFTPANDGEWYYDLAESAASEYMGVKKEGLPYYITTATVVASDDSATIVINPEDWSTPTLAAQSTYTYYRYTDDYNALNESNFNTLTSDKPLNKTVTPNRDYYYIGVAVTNSTIEPGFDPDLWEWSKYIGENGVSYELKLSTETIVVNTLGKNVTTSITATPYKTNGNSTPQRLTSDVYYRVYKDDTSVNINGVASTAKITGSNGILTLNTSQEGFNGGHNVRVELYLNNDAMLTSANISYVTDPNAMITIAQQAGDLYTNLTAMAGTVSSTTSSRWGDQLIYGTKYPHNRIARGDTDDHDHTKISLYYTHDLAIPEDDHLRVSYTPTNNDISTTKYFQVYWRANDPLIAGEQYTFSVDVTAFGDYIKLQVNNASTDLQWWDNSWKRLFVTFIASEDPAQNNLLIHCQLRKQRDSSWYFDVRRPKLEKGNLATPWCDTTYETPNPNLLKGTSRVLDILLKDGTYPNNIQLFIPDRLNNPDPDSWTRLRDNTAVSNIKDGDYARAYIRLGGEYLFDGMREGDTALPICAPLEKGKTYTLSADIMCHGDKFRMIGGNDSSAPVSWGWGDAYAGETREEQLRRQSISKRCYVNFTVADDTQPWLIFDSFWQTNDSINYIDIRRIKLEEGTHPTDWEDNDGVLYATRANFQQTIDGFETRVEKEIANAQSANEQLIEGAIDTYELIHTYLDISNGRDQGKKEIVSNYYSATSSLDSDTTYNGTQDRWVKISPKSDYGSYYTAWCYVPGLKTNTDYTFSVDIDNPGLPIRLRVNVINDTTNNNVHRPSGLYETWTGIRRKSFTFNTKGTIQSQGIELVIDCKPTSTPSNNYFKIRKLKLEVGTEATSWVPAEPWRASSFIKQTATEITSTVQEVWGDGKNKKSLRSEISQTAADITLKVNNRNYGNNLLLGSNHPYNIMSCYTTTAQSTAGAVITAIDSAADDKQEPWYQAKIKNGSFIQFSTKKQVKIKSNTKYTFSAQVWYDRPSSGAKVTEMRIGTPTKDSEDKENWHKYTDLSTTNYQYKRITHTFDSGDRTAMSLGVSFTFSENDTNGSLRVYVRRPKIEEGEEATDWCLSDDELYNSAVEINQDGVKVIGGTIEMNAGTKLNLNSGNQLNVNSGSINMNAASTFSVNAGTVKIAATNTNKDSFIRLGTEANPNFSVSETGDLEAKGGNFSALKVLNKRVLTTDDLPKKIIVSSTQPSGKDLIWLKPDGGTAKIEYSHKGFASRHDENNFNITKPISLTFKQEDTAKFNTAVTYTYSLDIPIYSVGETCDDFKVTVVLKKGSKTVTLTHSDGLSFRPNTLKWAYCSASSTTNLCDNNNDITAELTAKIGSSANNKNIFIQGTGAGSVSAYPLTLTISRPGNASVKPCEIFYIE